MDECTRYYRKRQFEKVATVYSKYQPKIKIVKPDGETNWFDITEEEWQKIKEYLLGNNK